MTQPTERPHEFESFDDKCCVPVGLGLLPCGQSKDAAIHEVILTAEDKLAAMKFDSEYQFRARRILKECETRVGVPLASDSVPNDLAIRIAIALAERDRLARRTFAPVEVHQTPEPQKLKCGNWGELDLHDPSCHYKGTVEYEQRVIDDDESTPPDQHVPPSPWCSPCRSYHPYPQTIEHWRKLGCKADRRDFTVGDQHVAPPRITIHDPREGALRTVYTERITDPLLRDVEYLAAAPIQAALEKCEADIIIDATDDYVGVLKSAYDALVKAVKGNHD